MRLLSPLCCWFTLCIVTLLGVANARGERWALEDMVGKDRDGRPLGMTSFRKDDGLTREVSAGDNPPFPEHQVLAATGTARQFCGLAVEVGEKQSHGSFAEFQKKVLAAEIDTAKLDAGIVQYKAADGKWLGFHWNDNPHNLGAWRNGKRHDWGRHALCLYCPRDADTRTGPIYSRWGSGTLYVEAGGQGRIADQAIGPKVDHVHLDFAARRFHRVGDIHTKRFGPNHTQVPAVEPHVGHVFHQAKVQPEVSTLLEILGHIEGLPIGRLAGIALDAWFGPLDPTDELVKLNCLGAPHFGSNVTSQPPPIARGSAHAG